MWRRCPHALGENGQIFVSIPRTYGHKHRGGYCSSACGRECERGRAGPWRSAGASPRRSERIGSRLDAGALDTLLEHDLAVECPETGHFGRDRLQALHLLLGRIVCSSRHHVEMVGQPR